MKMTTVSEWMTRNVVTVDVKTSLTDAHNIMKEANIRRLPVTSNKKMVGIVTIGDIHRALPSDATSLSVYELNYLISKISIDEIMSHDVISVAPKDSLQEVALKLLKNKIGGLPVIDKEERLVGIITEADIFRLVISQPEFGNPGY